MWRIGYNCAIPGNQIDMTISLGCIADDFTGATDLGLLIKQAGYSVIQTIGIPDVSELPASDAVVVALKSRTNPADEAVKETIDAYRTLSELGAEQFFFKYCSTFDSTEKGNIGPVADSLLQATGATVAVVCPAFPANGRTVYKGNLFVHDQPLSESPMRNHPLTPMRDSNLLRVLQAQSRSSIALVPLEIVEQGADRLRQCWQLAGGNGKTLMVVDAVNDNHLKIIGEAVLDHPLVTGGSALGAALVQAKITAGAGVAERQNDYSVDMPVGGSVVLAGSCSDATLKQITFARQNMPGLKLDIDQIAAGHFDAAKVLDWAQPFLKKTPVLIYASESAAERACRDCEVSNQIIGERIEQAMAELVPALVNAGVRRFVVAGGETSGSVVQSLGVRYLHIADEIDPGVPWTVSNGPLPVGLALKSGNFGGEDFFIKSLSMVGAFAQ